MSEVTRRVSRSNRRLTVEIDRVTDATFDETGTYLASFVIDEEIVGEIELPVYVQTAPAKLPKEVEELIRARWKATAKSDWIGQT